VGGRRRRLRSAADGATLGRSWYKGMVMEGYFNDAGGWHWQSVTAGFIPRRRRGTRTIRRDRDRLKDGIMAGRTFGRSRSSGLPDESGARRHMPSWSCERCGIGEEELRAFARAASALQVPQTVASSPSYRRQRRGRSKYVQWAESRGLRASKLIPNRAFLRPGGKLKAGIHNTHQGCRV
jgi:hypothetical protein